MHSHLTRNAARASACAAAGAAAHERKRPGRLGRPGRPAERRRLLRRVGHEPVGATAPATKLKVLLAFWPSVVMAAMHTTMMRASITAYSTAVGPSSFFRKLTRLAAKFFNMFRPFRE